MRQGELPFDMAGTHALISRLMLLVALLVGAYALAEASLSAAAAPMPGGPLSRSKILVVRAHLSVASPASSTSSRASTTDRRSSAIALERLRTGLGRVLPAVALVALGIFLRWRWSRRRR
jgi:hypothetical protein